MVFVTGDVHGDIYRFTSGPAKKLRRGDTLIVCGDFGFIWSGSAEEQRVLKSLTEKKFHICFVDGTHENFKLLNSYEVSEWKGGKVHYLGGNLYHLMRGQVFTIEDQTFFTMGGGESPDIDLRMQTNTWFKEESPSQQELLEGAANIERHGGRVNYIITHEPSARVKDFLQLKTLNKNRLSLLNTYLEELGNSCSYDKWYFGSMHLDKHVSSSQIAVFQNILEVESGKSI